MTNDAKKPSPRSAREREQRTELFKQVAVIVLTARPLLALKGAPADGKQLSDQFVEEVSLISEGIFAAAKTFGEEK